MLEVTSLIVLESNDRFNIIGIYGIGRIGKLAIAYVVHNLIDDQFENMCYLADIRERETNHNLAQLKDLQASSW